MSLKVTAKVTLPLPSADKEHKVELEDRLQDDENDAAEFAGWPKMDGCRPCAVYHELHHGFFFTSGLFFFSSFAWAWKP